MVLTLEGRTGELKTFLSNCIQFKSNPCISSAPSLPSLGAATAHAHPNSGCPTQGGHAHGYKQKMEEAEEGLQPVVQAEMGMVGASPQTTHVSQDTM